MTRASLETPRLSLRLLERDHHRAIHEGRRAPDWAPDYPTEGDVVIAGLVLARATEEAPWDCWEVRDRTSGLVVGGIGLRPLAAPGETEVGYGLVPSVRGRGLATEAVAAVVAEARARGGSAVVAETDPDNVASQRVLEKNGFARVPAEGEALRWRLTFA